MSDAEDTPDYDLPEPLSRLLAIGRETPLGSRYLVRGYRSKEGRVCDFLIASLDFREAAQISLEQIAELTPRAIVTRGEVDGVSHDMAEKALVAVRKDWRRASQEGPRLRYAMPAPGFLLHLGKGALYLHGVLRGRREIRPAPPRKRPRSTYAQVRRWIEKQTMAGSWRQLRLGADNWNTVEIGSRVIAREPRWIPWGVRGEDTGWVYEAPSAREVDAA